MEIDAYSAPQTLNCIFKLNLALKTIAAFFSEKNLAYHIETSPLIC